MCKPYHVKEGNTFGMSSIQTLSMSSKPYDIILSEGNLFYKQWSDMQFGLKGEERKKERKCQDADSLKSMGREKAYWAWAKCIPAISHVNK